MAELLLLGGKEEVKVVEVWATGQYTQDTGTHWLVVHTRSMASSRFLMVSSISLLMMVWSK